MTKQHNKEENKVQQKAFPPAIQRNAPLTPYGICVIIKLLLETHSTLLKRISKYSILLLIAMCIIF